MTAYESMRRAVYATAVSLATIVGGGCGLLESRDPAQVKAYQEQSAKDEITRIRDVLTYGTKDKDGAVNTPGVLTDKLVAPNLKSGETNEIKMILAQREAIAGLRGHDYVKASPEWQARLDRLDALAESYLADVANSDKVRGNIIIRRLINPTDKLPWTFGLHYVKGEDGKVKGDHWEITGTLADHVRDLGVNRDVALLRLQSVTGSRWGIPYGKHVTDELDFKIAGDSSVVPTVFWTNVVNYFPEVVEPVAGKVRELKTPSGKQILRAEELAAWFGNRQVTDINIMHVLESGVQPSEATLALLKQVEEAFGSSN